MSCPLVLAFVCALAQQSASPLALRPGEPIEAELPESGAKGAVFELLPVRAGWMTVLLESLDFDARLGVDGPTGKLAAAGHSVVGTHERAIFEVSPGSRWRVSVSGGADSTGAFRLSAFEGRPEERSSRDQLLVELSLLDGAARRAMQRGARARAAKLLVRRGRLAYDAEWLPIAETSFLAALTEARAAGEKPSEAIALAHVGAIARWSGRPMEALERLEHALPMLTEQHERELECFALVHAGDAWLDLAEPAKARESFQDMLERADQASLKREAAVAWSKIGAARLRLGDVEAAEECHARAEQLAGLSSDPDTLADVLMRHAVDCQVVGQAGRSLELLVRALERPRSKMLQMDAVGATGNALLALGRTQEARRCYDVARGIALELGLPASEALFLLCSGNLEMADGNVPRARLDLERAAALLSGDECAPKRGEVLLSLGQVLSDLGDAQAFVPYAAATAIARWTCNRSLEARALQGLAHCYASAGRLEEAERRCTEACSAVELCDDVEARAATRGTLAWTRHLRGERGEAEQSARESFALYRALGMDWQCLEMLDLLAKSALARRDAGAASHALDLARGIFDGDLLEASELDRCANLRSHFAGWSENVQDMATLRLDSPDLSESDRDLHVARGFVQAGEWKGRALLGGLSAKRRGERSAERTAALEKAADSRKRRLESLRRVSAAIQDGEPSDVLRPLLEEADAVRTEADSLATQVLRAERACELPPDGAPDLVASVRRALPDDRTVLVEYACGSERIYAYVLTRGSFHRLDLGERRPIEERVQRLLTGIARATAMRREELLQLGAQLFDDLLRRPLAASGPVERIIVVPSLPLAGLPFEALLYEPVPGAAGLRFEDAPFVVRKYEVAYVPSSPVMVELSGLERRGGDPSVLLMVDPKYPEPSGTQVQSVMSATRPARSLPRLSTTRAEGCLVARLMGAGAGVRDEDILDVELERRDRLSGQNFELLAGVEATPLRLREAGQRFSVIHIAAHGFADLADPDESALALAFGSNSSGWLTYRDVMRLSLGADLAVLSACETGLGPRLAGEGVLSVGRAFLWAGARSVIASLWEVDDQQTGLLMRAFYKRYLLERVSPAHALRQAKLDVFPLPRARGEPVVAAAAAAGRFVESADPWYWAPFVYVGVPR